MLVSVPLTTALAAALVHRVPAAAMPASVPRGVHAAYPTPLPEAGAVAAVVRYGVGVVHAPQRRFFAVMVALAVVTAVLQGAAGLTDLVVYAGPVLLIAGLLLCGRFVGEERIVRRLRRVAMVMRPRRVRARWPRVPARTLSSLLAHDPRDERGPPAGKLAA